MSEKDISLVNPVIRAFAFTVGIISTMVPNFLRKPKPDYLCNKMYHYVS